MKRKSVVKCHKCKIEYEIQYEVPSENVHTTYVICPRCRRKIYCASDFGFGPVWPAYMYNGNELILSVEFLPNNECLINEGINLSREIKIPKIYLINNYVCHTKILDFIYKKIKKQL